MKPISQTPHSSFGKPSLLTGKLTKADIGRKTGMNRSIINELIHIHKIPVLKVGKIYYIDESSLKFFK